jgi:hypothetical protein
MPLLWLSARGYDVDIESASMLVRGITFKAAGFAFALHSHC